MSHPVSHHRFRLPRSAAAALLALAATSACTVQAGPAAPGNQPIGTTQPQGSASTPGTGGQSAVRTSAPGATSGSGAATLRYADMKEPICSVSTQVPTSWPQSTRSTYEARFEPSGGIEESLTVGCLDDEDGGKSPDGYLRTHADQVAAGLADYHRVRLTGLQRDQHGAYADWEYTYAATGGTRHALLRVYGSYLDGAAQPTALATLQLDTVDAVYPVVQPVLQHAIEHVSWDH